MLLQLWSLVPRPVQLAVIRTVQRNQRAYRWLMFRHYDLKERVNGAGANLPPAEMRYRVSGSPHAHDFIAIGKRCAADIQSALQRVDLDLGSFTRILDFGCGCGRAL
ncbi:MAG TPA: hypothetical protein VFI71_02045, partial [Pyrinomonadaceae bacterium]|nr:hypothetical protein [Pyrinomonadaceae bacterium]